MKKLITVPVLIIICTALMLNCKGKNDNADKAKKTESTEQPPTAEELLQLKNEIIEKDERLDSVTHFGKSRYSFHITLLNVDSSTADIIPMANELSRRYDSIFLTRKMFTCLRNANIPATFYFLDKNGKQIHIEVN
jgi:hypothetical protein